MIKTVEMKIFKQTYIYMFSMSAITALLLPDPMVPLMLFCCAIWVFNTEQGTF